MSNMMKSGMRIRAAGIPPFFHRIFLAAMLGISGFHALHGQKIAPDVYWIYFTDKHNSGFEVSEPEAFLSARSIERRAWQGLSIDATDLPVSGTYVDNLKNRGLEVLHVSKWLNGVAFRSSDPNILETLYKEPFIDSLQWTFPADENYAPPLPSNKRFNDPLDTPPDYDYGYSREQIEMIHVDILHKKGLTGSGVHIAVLDAGFKNVDSVPSFAAMISEGRLLDTVNFLGKYDMFRMSSAHGMYVLSIMGAEWNGNLIGTAPHATYLLCTTENPYSEYPVEEVAWIEAAELADSLGFDVINTSLGYSVFDDSLLNYTYEDMDGKTTYISRAASMLAKKGIIATNSAGNSGDDDWYYITAPADAKHILTVGAVDSLNHITEFSSRGPAYDHRIKPDVVGMGRATAVQYFTGIPARGGGTSFSSPVIAGAVAVLWQAFPDLPAEDLIRIVQSNADRFRNPDATYGYGLPNFARAYFDITSRPAFLSAESLEIYPNPATHFIMIKAPEALQQEYTLKYYDMQGRLIHQQILYLPGETELPKSLSPGIYMLQIRTGNGVYHTRLIRH